ncbi:MAG: histidine kinase [Oscillospiraceae bacterium]|nr:histidine kinase [Oscillospiraceae bacterium]
MNKFLLKLRDSKYRTKLSIVMVLVGIVPLLLLGITLYSEFSQVVSSEELTNMKTSLLQAGTAVENQVSKDDLISQYVAFNEDLNRALSLDSTERYEKYRMYNHTVKPLMATVRYFQKDIHSTCIYSQNVTTSYGTILQPLSQLEPQKWYYKAKSGGIQWILDSAQPNYILSVCKVPNYQNHSSSYLAIQYSLSSFLQPFEQMEQKNTGLAVFTEGRLLYSSGTIGKEDCTSQAAFSAAVQGKRTCVQRHIDGLDWDVYLYATGYSLSAAAKTTIMRTLGMLCVCLLVLFVLVRLLSHTMTRRIEALTQNMVAVSQGNMELTATSRAKDEIGILVQNFRRMIQKIDRLIHEVYASQLAQKEAELKALQSQINPHFLYNSLSMINWKALACGQTDISHITLSLSRFYRTTLNKGKSMLTAEDELKNIQAYLDIQLMMHDNQFTVTWEVEDAVKPYFVPKLILQPIVENALEHGLDVKENGDKKLFISAKCVDDTIVFCVRDNGVGMTQKKADSIIQEETSGYGMKNVNDRITLLYGMEYALKIRSSPGEGTSVTAVIPKDSKGAMNREK